MDFKRLVTLLDSFSGGGVSMSQDGAGSAAPSTQGTGGVFGAYTPGQYAPGDARTPDVIGMFVRSAEFVPASATLSGDMTSASLSGMSLNDKLSIPKKENKPV